MKKLIAYFLLIPLTIRANFLKAYRETRRTGKFTYKFDRPEFFKTKTEASTLANTNALRQGIRYHVIEPEKGKFVAVSEKYMKNSPFKSVYHTI